MMTNILKAKWSQIKGKAKVQWSKLTDDDLLRIEGEKDKLIGKIQERYSLTKDQATADVDKFIVRHTQDEEDNE
ncbi:MAG: CsbD family protein [Gammaproteobacteria bacterium]|nr:CsbD family protein [Gammaproteobacteria bacterium]